MAASMKPSASTRKIIKNLKQFHTKLQIRALSANLEIAKNTKGALMDIYPPRLGARWDVYSMKPKKTVLAKMVMNGERPEIRGYEFGTPPHVILPNSAKALRFSAASLGTFAIVFAKKVNHPGTPAHNRRQSALIAFGMACRTEWLAAFDDTLLSID